MSYIRHDAIVVTSNNTALIEEAHNRADALGLVTSRIINSPVNGYQSFLVVPDGSNETRPLSASYDLQRRQFIEWMQSTRSKEYGYTTALDWVAVSFGRDSDLAYVTSDSKDRD